MGKSVLQALIATGFSISAAIGVYVLARKQKLNFRYAIGWLVLCLVGVVAGLGTSVIQPVAQSLGITASALIGLTAMLLLILLAIQLSVSISGLQLQNRRLAEQLAILGHTTNVLLEAPSSTNQVLNKSNVLILMPAFNEAMNLGDMVTDILQDGYQVLVIDDGSADNTKSVATEHGVGVLVLPFNLGVGGALKAGFKRACDLKYLAVVQVDADGQHQAKEITHLLDEANTTEAHLVIGSRFRSLDNELITGKSRRFVMKMLARSASAATSTQITDPTSGFRLIRQPLLAEFSQNFPINYLGDTYEALISAGRAGYTVREVPAAMKNRVHGVSSATKIQAVKFIVKSVLVASVRLHNRIPQYGQQNSQKFQ